MAILFFHRYVPPGLYGWQCPECKTWGSPEATVWKVDDQEMIYSEAFSVDSSSVELIRCINCPD